MIFFALVKWLFITFISVSLAFSCLSFLTTIWGQGVVFVWLLNVIGLSSLVVWTSIGFISLRFRQAYKAQGLSLSDLPFQQPLYPLLPIGVIVLGTLMFIALGYASVRQEPFNPRVSTIFSTKHNKDFRKIHIIYIFFRMWLQPTLASPCLSSYFLDIWYTRGCFKGRRNILYPSLKSTLCLMLYGNLGKETGYAHKIRRIRKRRCLQWN